MARKRAARKRGKLAESLRFSPALVFGTGEVKKEDLDFDLCLETARYKARKGEGGTRHGPSVPPSDPLPGYCRGCGGVSRSACVC